MKFNDKPTPIEQIKSGDIVVFNRKLNLIALVLSVIKKKVTFLYNGEIVTSENCIYLCKISL